MRALTPERVKRVTDSLLEYVAWWEIEADEQRWSLDDWDSFLKSATQELHRHVWGKAGSRVFDYAVRAAFLRLNLRAGRPISQVDEEAYRLVLEDLLPKEGSEVRWETMTG